MTYLDIFQDAPWWIWVIHIALYPLYQIIGTWKHEGAHALAAKAQGLTIVEFKFIPSRVDGRWLWGYVRWTGGVANMTTLLMPYYVDAALFCVSVGLFTGIAEEWWAQHIQLFFLSFILTIILPLVDVIYNLGKWWIKDTGDFAEAFKDIG